MLIDLTIIEQRLKNRDVSKVVYEGVNILLEEIIAACKPVRNYQSEDGSKERLPTESHDIRGKEYPKDRNKEYDLNEGNGRDAYENECIEDSSGSMFVLISMKKGDITGRHTHHDNGSADAWKQEAGHRTEHQKGAGNHSAVDAQQGIAVVELHHQQSGDGKTGKLNPQSVLP
jgi:hypothetical protein